MGPLRPTLRRLSSRSARNPVSTTPLDEFGEEPFSINATPPLGDLRAHAAASDASTWSASPPPSSRQSLWGRVLGMKRYSVGPRSHKYSGGDSEVDSGSAPTSSIRFPPTSSRTVSSAPTTAAPCSDDERRPGSFPFPDMSTLAAYEFEPAPPQAPAPPRPPRAPVLAARPWLDPSGRALTPVSSGSEGTPSPGSTASDESSSRSHGSFTPSLPRVTEGVPFPPSPVAVARAGLQTPSSNKGKPFGRGRSRRRRIEPGSRTSSSSASGRNEAAPSTSTAGSSSQQAQGPSMPTTRRSTSSCSLAELIADDARDYSSSSDSQRSPRARDVAPRIKPSPSHKEYERLVEPARPTSGDSSSGSGSDWPPRGLTSHFSDWTTSSGSSRRASGSHGRSSLERASAPGDDDLFGAVPAALERGPHPRPAAHASQAPTALVVEDKVDKAASSSSSSTADKAKKRSRSTRGPSASELSPAEARSEVDDGGQALHVPRLGPGVGTVKEGVGDGVC